MSESLPFHFDRLVNVVFAERFKRVNGWTVFQDGNVEPEDFTNQLQKELKSSPQPYLVPFLRVGWLALGQKLTLMLSLDTMSRGVSQLSCHEVLLQWIIFYGCSF